MFICKYYNFFFSKANMDNYMLLKKTKQKNVQGKSRIEVHEGSADLDYMIHVIYKDKGAYNHPSPPKENPLKNSSNGSQFLSRFLR